MDDLLQRLLRLCTHFPSREQSGARPISKDKLRREMRRVRGALGAPLRQAAAQALVQPGVELLASHPTSRVAGYVAMGDEIDPLGLLQALSENGHKLALPCVVKRDAALEFRHWSPGEPLVKGDLGTRQPGHEARVVDPDILLMPLVAFDMAGHRLGLGGGYYDRTLAAIRSGRHVMAVGIAFDEQRADALPQEANDQPLDWVITPSGVLNVK